jgi:hypothetical protein
VAPARPGPSSLIQDLDQGLKNSTESQNPVLAEFWCRFIDEINPVAKSGPGRIRRQISANSMEFVNLDLD